MSGLSRTDIDDILRLVENSSFDELRLEMGDIKIEVRRAGAAPSAAPSAPPALPAAPAASAAPSAPTPAAPAPPAPRGDGVDVPAPLLGVFYHAPKPGADPFVRVGDTVEVDTVIGIVEVMKLMNSVTAGVAGVVTEVVAPNGQLVEHGDTLIRVRPA